MELLWTEDNLFNSVNFCFWNVIIIIIKSMLVVQSKCAIFWLDVHCWMSIAMSSISIVCVVLWCGSGSNAIFRWFKRKPIFLWFRVWGDPASTLSTKFEIQTNRTKISLQAILFLNKSLHISLIKSTFPMKGGLLMSINLSKQCVLPLTLVISISSGWFNEHKCKS